MKETLHMIMSHVINWCQPQHPLFLLPEFAALAAASRFGQRD
jgi:hypothetical protein